MMMGGWFAATAIGNYLVSVPGLLWMRIPLWSIWAVLIAICSTVLLMIPLLFFRESVVAFFNDKPEVIEYGSLLLKWMTPFYVLCCFNQIYGGALRGAGNSRAPMVILLLSYVGFRQLYLLGMSNICNEIIPIAMSYPAGWLLCSIITGIYYHKVSLEKTRLVDDKE
jgi:Na+-driven multidrug efflux pump